MSKKRPFLVFIGNEEVAISSHATIAAAMKVAKGRYKVWGPVGPGSTGPAEWLYKP